MTESITPPPINVTQASLNLFNTYLGKSYTADELAAFASDFRMKAWEKTGALYTCVGQAMFLFPRTMEHSKYSEIVQFLKENKNASILDIGCGFGTDIRQLIVDGVPQSQIYGLDIDDAFFKLGFDLFSETAKKEAFEKNFIKTSILDADFPEQMEKWHPGGFDIIFMGSVLHLFTEEPIKVALKNVHKILKPNGILVGRNLGAANAFLKSQEFKGKKFEMYLHSPESLKNEMATAGYHTDSAVIGWAAGEAVNSLNAARLGLHTDGEKMMEFYVRA